MTTTSYFLYRKTFNLLNYKGRRKKSRAKEVEEEGELHAISRMKKRGEFDFRPLGKGKKVSE